MADADGGAQATHAHIARSGESLRPSATRQAGAAR
jgi:hypothetical protein